MEREQAGELERSGQVQSSLAEAQARLKTVKAALKGLDGQTAAATAKLQQGDTSTDACTDYKEEIKHKGQNLRKLGAGPAEGGQSCP